MKAPSTLASSARNYFLRPPFSRRWSWYALALLFVVADYFCGQFFLFPIFFIFPVILAGWNSARRDAIVLALGLTATRLAFTLMWSAPAALWTDAINAVVRGMVLVILGVLVARVAEQNRELARRISQLEGLLPICSHCKRILDEEKRWTQFETYIVQHTAAEFTHGICPECAQKHYGMTAPNEAAF